MARTTNIFNWGAYWADNRVHIAKIVLLQDPLYQYKLENILCLRVQAIKSKGNQFQVHVHQYYVASKARAQEKMAQTK